jgi:group I intron endonuclease
MTEQILKLGKRIYGEKSGIYYIYSKINNKIYIGQSKNIKKRWRGHKSDLRRNKHGNIFLQRIYNKYGLNNFIFKVLEICDLEKLSEREEYFVSIIEKENLINILKVGEITFPTTNTFKEKMSEIAKKRNSNPEYWKKWRQSRLENANLDKNGKIIFSDEHKKRIGEVQKGKKQSQETINKRLEKSKITREINKKLGRKRKSRTIKQIISKETREKIRKANLGKKMSEETKEKIRLAHLGKPKSKESIQKRLGTIKQKRQSNQDSK